MRSICFICLLLLGHVDSYAQGKQTSKQPQQKTPSVRQQQEKSRDQLARDTQWQPIIEMDKLIFPSMILATATIKQSSASPTYVGDAYGLFGISITSPKDDCLVDLTIQVDEIASPAIYEATLPRKGVTYEIFPPLEYRFDRLIRVIQPFPINIVFKVKVDGGPLMTVAHRAQVRPINECPFAWRHRTGPVQQQGWMFAAYVNEDHPWIEGLLNEAINTGVVNRFVGYQGSRNDVITQVFSIWNVLQRRGFKYSSITTTSALSNNVFSQRVRFLSDSIKTSQANCVDGSVLFASVLRKIGLDVFLVLQPGHCFLGFWLDSQHQNSMFLETTMLGNTNLQNYGEDGTLRGALAELLGHNTRNQASFQSFSAATTVGLQKARSVSPAEARTNSQYQMVDISEARKRGISPLAW